VRITAPSKKQQRHLCGIYSPDGAARGWALKTPSTGTSILATKGSMVNDDFVDADARRGLASPPRG
jgi:hypothetical protein